MVSLLVEHVGKIGGQAGLGQPHVKAVRESVAEEPVESPHSLSPDIGQGEPVAPEHGEFGAPRVSGPDLEAGRED